MVIDWPNASGNKYGSVFKLGVYVMKTVMPKGMVWPFDFGSIAGTRGEEGDPLDALILMDEPAFCGCYVESRLLA